MSVNLKYKSHLFRINKILARSGEQYFSKMKNKSSKHTLRIENKKKKMAALVRISKLNEYDRLAKTPQPDSVIEPEPSPSKRPKIEPMELDSIELGTSGKAKLSGEEFLQLKRMLREKTSKWRQQPLFRLRELGSNASLNLEIDNRVPLFLSDLQHLIMYSQLGHHSPYSPARWCGLEKFNRLVNTCVFIIENVTLNHYVTHQQMFPFLCSQFDNKVEVLAPQTCHSDIIKDLSMVPLTGTQMKKYINEFGNLSDAVHKSPEVFDTIKHLFPIEKLKKSQIINNVTLPDTDKFPRIQLLLSGWQMVEENYPLPIKGLMERKYNGYILTKDEYEDVTPFSKMYGIDCEMCITTTGDLELTRVSIVDEDLNLFYDTLVKPDNKITNYLTRFSGITHDMMRDVKKRLCDVQEDLRKLLPKDAILVGQSLSNDLHALKMMHPYVIDTSVIFNITGDRTRKTKLKTLAREFLSERIQEGRGHCSTEDSLAAMKLTKLKLTKSLYFGDAVMGNVQMDMRAYPELGTSNYATSMLKQTTKIDKTALIVGLEEISVKYKYYCDKGNGDDLNGKIVCKSEKSNKECIRTICDKLKQFSLTIGHVKINDNQLDGSKIFKNIDKWIGEIYNSILTPGFFIVIFGGNHRGNGGCFLQIKNEI